MQIRLSLSVKALVLTTMAVCMLAFTAVRAQTIPDFKFYTLDGKSYSRKNLAAGKPTLVFYFSPDCDHCQKQGEWIKAEAGLLKNAQIVMVTWEENADMIRKYQSTYFPKPPMPVTFTQDKEYKIDEWFGECTAPTLFIYNKTGKLVKKATQETTVKELARLMGLGA